MHFKVAVLIQPLTSNEASSSDRYTNLLYWSVPEFYSMTHRFFLSRVGMARLFLASLSVVNSFDFSLHPSGCIIAILGDKIFLLKRPNSVVSERTVWTIVTRNAEQLLCS